MSQPRTISTLIRDLEKYYRIGGDMPCYIASGKEMMPLTASLCGTMTLDNVTEDARISMNVVMLCDPEACDIIMKESEENEALTDSTYDE